MMGNNWDDVNAKYACKAAVALTLGVVLGVVCLPFLFLANDSFLNSSFWGFVVQIGSLFSIVLLFYGGFFFMDSWLVWDLDRKFGSKD